MATMTGIEHRLVTGLSLTMTRYDVVCVHTIVGFAPASAAHFSTRANGQVIQSRDTRFRSAANLNGNHRVIAIENEDHGAAFGAWNTRDGHAVPAFTSQQCEAIARICVWAYRTHGIPLVLCPDSRPTSRGIAYHRQGIDSPNNFAGYAYRGRVAGGEVWTEHTGKVCPGDRRITQLINVIIPRAQVLVGLRKDDDVVDWDQEYTFGRTGLRTAYGNWIGETNAAANNAARDAAVVRAQLGALTSTLSDRHAAVVAAFQRVVDAIEADDDVVSPEQLEQLREALAAGLPGDLVDQFVDALRDRLTETGEPEPPTGT